MNLACNESYTHTKFQIPSSLMWPFTEKKMVRIFITIRKCNFSFSPHFRWSEGILLNFLFYLQAETKSEKLQPDFGKFSGCENQGLMMGSCCSMHFVVMCASGNPLQTRSPLQPHFVLFCILPPSDQNGLKTKKCLIRTIGCFALLGLRLLEGSQDLALQRLGII